MPGFRVCAGYCSKDHGGTADLSFLQGKDRAGDRGRYSQGRDQTGRPADDRAFGFAAVEDFHCRAGGEEGREGDFGAGAGHRIKGLLAGDRVSLIVDRAGRW